MKKAIILCNLDAFANSIKPKKIKEFLEENKYSVDLYSTETLSRLGTGKYSHLLPGLGFNQMKLYCLEALFYFAITRKHNHLRKKTMSFILLKILKVRGIILKDKLSRENYDLLICENNLDEAIVATRIAKIQILDLPAPYAEEMFYGGELTEQKYSQLKDFEKNLYEKADYISFHWHTYAEFVKKQKYNGNNFIDLTYGTTPKRKFAQFSEKPKIIFLGYLGGYWVNLPLLEELSKIYSIDVYGGPSIPKLKINYKGYAPSLDVLADYQFGLITITDDPLRQSSFSSKQLEYFSYGLPVLTPEWRKDSVLEDGSIYYNKNNFISLIRYHSNKDKWNKKSAQAIKIANEMNWKNALKPLNDIIL